MGNVCGGGGSVSYTYQGKIFGWQKSENMQIEQEGFHTKALKTET